MKSAQKKESVLVDVDIICFHLNNGLISKWFFDHENLGDWTRTERWPAGDGLLGSSCHPDRGSLRCWGNTSLDFSVAQTIQIQRPVVVGTSFDFLGISAETGLVIESDLEDRAERATVFAGVTVHANVVLTAILWVGVATEGTGGDISSDWTNESISNFFLFTVGNLIGPGTNAAFPAVSQAGGALITASFAVPAAPENIAFGLVGEDSVQARAVRSTDWWFKFETISAFDVVDVIAVFTVVLGVGVIESQAIAADFQRSHSIYAFPVFVAGNVVSEEAVFLRANKRIAANVLGRSGSDDDGHDDEGASHRRQLLGRIETNF